MTMNCTTDKNNPKAFAVQSRSIESDVQIGCRNDRRYSKLVRLRKKPGGKILSSAHAVEREFQVQFALKKKHPTSQSQGWFCCAKTVQF